MSLIAPDYVTPRYRRHRPPIVSLKPVGESVAHGIKLWVNADKYGFQLADGAEGFGMADVENTLTAVAGGGAVLRHQRLVEGEMYLPIQLTAPSSAALDDMTAHLADIVNPANGEFEVVYYSPVSNESRIRRVAYKSGLLTPAVWLPHVGYAEYGITAEFVEPFWKGVERPLTFEVAPQRKPLITAYQGAPDTENPSITFEWEGERGASTSVMKSGGEVAIRNVVVGGSFENLSHPGWHGTGASMSVTTSWVGQMFDPSHGGEGPESGRYGENIAMATGFSDDRDDFYIIQSADAYIPIKPGEWLGVSGLVATDKNMKADIVVQFRDSNGATISNRSDYQTGDFYSGRKVHKAEQAPAGTVNARLVIWARTNDGSSSNGLRLWAEGVIGVIADSEDEALEHSETYFDGDTAPVMGRYEGYEFPFFPMMIHSAVVEGEQELRIEGDAPTWPTYTVYGPGEDLLLENKDGQQLYVPGRIDGQITITTEPGRQTIRDQNGESLMSRLIVGQDVFFPLEPGDQKIKATMVNATPESRVRLVYQEQFKLPAGNSRNVNG